MRVATWRCLFGYALTHFIVVLMCVTLYLMWTGKTINYPLLLSNVISGFMRERILLSFCRRKYKASLVVQRISFLIFT